MESTFLISTSKCASCNNQTLKTLGNLQGVFGVDIDRIEGKIVVSHTDEITHNSISKVLSGQGFSLKEAHQDIAHDDPSIWGCSL